MELISEDRVNRGSCFKSKYMDASILNLRKVIKESLTPTISLHRKSRGTLDKLGDTEVKQEEIDRIMFSIPYLDRPLC